MKLFLLIFALFTGIQAQENYAIGTCGRKQCRAAEKFSYESGHSYVYNYEANVVTSIQGSSEDFTSIFIETQAEIHAITTCEFVLKLRQVNLRSRDVDNPVPSNYAAGHDDFKKALELRPLFFSFDDGTIDLLCADHRESQWVLNIKRAILSTLQNNAKNVVTGTKTMERDILGDCPTEYILDYEWTSVKAKKTKELDKCHERHAFRSAIQSTPYTSPKGSPLSPILHNSYSCEQTIEHLIIQRVSCEERHLLRPFSNGDSGAVTLTKQTLNLIDDVQRPFSFEKDATSGLQKTNLLFHHDYKSPLKEDSNHQHNAEIALHQLCEQSRDDVRPETPHLFWRLITTLRHLNYSKTAEIFHNVDRICDFTSRGQKLFRDALGMVNSVASVTLMKELILDLSAPPSEVSSWLGALAFYPNPTREVLAAVMPLVTVSEPPPKTLLSLASLAHSYCQTDARCNATEEVHTLIGLIESRLGDNCFSRHADETQRIVVALKALGNLGQWNKPLTVLERCATDDTNPLAVRISAIEAYRRLSCDVSRRHLLRSFLNYEEDVEIRIASYLAVMKCPSAIIVDDIWKALMNENVNQVNSFVWSHLHSIRNSVDPCKSHLVTILEEADLKEKYPQDIRKFSRAFERSAFSERENGGANLEAHLIYSPNSFIPRSAMLNMTVDLFGQSINLLELSGRISGVDFLAESFFRPEPKPVEVQLRETKNGERPSAENQEDNQIHQLSKTIRSKAKKRYQTSQPEGALSMKVFGQEVWYGNVGSEEIEAAVAGLDHYGLANFLARFSQDREVELKQDSVLLDSTFVTPTLSGLPLVLSLNATASVHLKMAGKMELPPTMIKGNTNIQGYIKPSVGVSILATMVVDGYVGKSGLKLDANFHTSTAIDGAIEMSNPGKFKLHLNMPKEKIDFTQISTNIVLNHWNVDRALRVSSANRNDYSGCTTDWTSKPLGVEICTEIRYSNATDKLSAPYFPLNGPTRIAFWLRKTDPLLSVYHFDYWRQRSDLSEDSHFSAVPQGFLLSFRTPHSKVDREWTAEYIINPMEQSLSVRFISPYKKVIAKGHYSNEVSRKTIYANIDVDGYEALSVQSELRIEKRDDHTQYVPKVIVKVPSHTVLSLEGFCNYSPGRHLSVDMTIENLTNKPIIFRSEITKSDDVPEGVKYDGVFNSPMLDASCKGYLNKTEGGLTSKTKIEYRMGGSGGKKETIDLTMKMRYQSPPSRSLTTASATFDIHMSETPQYNLVVDWDYQLAEGHVENTISVERYDELDRRGGSRLLFLQQISTYEGTIDHNKMAGKLVVTVPARDVDFLVQLDHQNLLNALHSKLHLRNGIDRDYGLELLFRDDSADLANVSALVRVRSGKVENRVSVHVTEEQALQYRALVASVGKPFGNQSAIIIYQNRGSPISINQILHVQSMGSFQLRGSATAYVTEESGQLVVEGIYDDKHRFNGDVQYNLIRPLEYNVSFAIKRSETASFKGKAKLNTGEEKMLSFDIINESGRRVTGDTSLKLFYDTKAFVVNVAWDVNGDPTQRFNFSIAHHRFPDQRDMSLMLSYLERAIHLELSHHSHHLAPILFAQGTHILVEWAGARKLGADLHLRVHNPRNRRNVTANLHIFTPLAGLETVSVNATHSDDGLSWKSDGAANINRKYPIHVTSSGKTWRHSNQHFVDATTNISMPFEGLEHIVLTLGHDMAASEIKTLARIQWLHNSSVVIQLHGIKPDSNYERAMAGINITTPFDAFLNLNFSLRHSLSNRKFDDGLLLLWNGDRLIDFIAVGESVRRNGTDYRVSGTVSLNTPLKGFTNVTATLDHAQTATGFRTLVRSLMPHRKFVAVTIDGNNLRLDHSVLVGGGINIQSPVITCGTSLEYRRSDSNFSCHVAGNWKNSSAFLGVDGEYKSMLDFHLGSTMTTPIAGLENTTLSLVNRIRSSSIDSRLKGNLGDTVAGVNLDARWEFASTVKAHSLSGNFKLDSPVESFPNVFLELDHHKEASSLAVYRSNIRGGWAETVATIDHALVLHNSLNFKDSLELSLPIEGMEFVQMTINQSLIDGQLQNNFQLTVLEDVYASTDLALSLKPQSLTNRMREIHSLLTVYSSIWIPNKVRISLDHEDNGVEYYPKICLQTIDPTETNKSMNVTVYFKSLGGNKNFRIDVASSIPRHETMSLAGMYNIRGDELDFDLSTQWTNTDKLSVDGQLAIDFMAPRLHLAIQTPTDGYNLFQVDGSYNVWSHEKIAYFFVQKESWNISLVGSGTFKNDAMTAGLVVTTLDPSVGVINVNITSGWGAPLRGFKASTTWSTKKAVKLSLLMKPSRGGESTVALSLQTPLEQIRIVDTTVRIARDHVSKRTTVETTARWNRADIAEATISFNEDPLSGFPFDLSVGVKSTSPIIPTITIVCYVKSRPNHRLTQIKLEYQSFKWQLDGDIKYRGRKTDVEFRLETPLAYFSKASLNSSFRSKGQNQQYEVSINATLPFDTLQSIKFDGNLNPSTDPTLDKTTWSRGTLILTSSSTRLAVLDTHFQLKSTGFTILLKSSVPVTIWKIKEIQVQCEAIPSHHNYLLGGHLKSENVEPLTFNAQMKGPPTDCHISGSLSSPRLLQQRNPVEVEMIMRLPSTKHQGTGLYVKFEARESKAVRHHLVLDLSTNEPASSSIQFVTFSPLFNSESLPYNVSAKLIDTEKGLQASSRVVLPSNTFSCNAEYELDEPAGSIYFLMDAESTVKELNKFRIYSRQIGKEWDNIVAHLDVVVPIEGYHKFSSRVETRHRLNEVFDLGIYVDTPFDGYENISLVEKLIYDLNIYAASSRSDIVFDGVTLNMGARYNKSGGVFDVAVESEWRPSEGGQKSIMPRVKSSGRTKLSLLCGPDIRSDLMVNGKTGRECSVELLSKGTPWEAEGFWNYSGWRRFDGEIFMDTPFAPSGRFGFGASNKMPVKKSELASQLSVHWAGKLKALVQVLVNSSESQKRGSLNITTPFAIVRQVCGRGYLERNESGLVSSVDVDVNGQTIVVGALEWLTSRDADWLNKTMLLDFENPWRPFSLSALTSRSAGQFTINSSLVWNHEDQQEANKVGADLGVFYLAHGREARFDFRHPKHEGGLQTFYEKIDSDFRHAFNLRWGRSRATLIAYNMWLRAKILAEAAAASSGLRRDAGFHWEHPGRHIVCVADVVQRPLATRAELDFKWDSARNDQKRIRLFAQYNNTSNQYRRQHKLQVGLRHPRLLRDVELNANTTFGFGRELFESKLSLDYSPHEEDRLVLSANLMDVTSAAVGSGSAGLRTVGVAMHMLATHPASSLDFRLSSDWLKTRNVASTNTSLIYLNRFDQQVVFSLEGAGDFVNENGTLLMNSPGHTTQFYLVLIHPNRNNYTVIATKHIDSDPSYSSRFYYQPDNPYVEANVTLEREKPELIRLMGGFASPRHLDFQIVHENGAQLVRDISAILKLNTTHLLTARAYWSTNISAHMQEAINSYIRGVHRQSVTSVLMLWDASIAELSDKMRLGWSTFTVSLQPLVSEAQTEIEACLHDFQHVRDYLAAMYRDNDLLARDVVKLLEKSQGYFTEWYTMVSEPFDWDMEAAYDYVHNALVALREAWHATWEDWNELLSDWIDQIWSGLIHTLKTGAGLLEQLWDRAGALLSRLPQLVRNLLVNVNSSNSEMMEHLAKLNAIVEKIRQLWEKFSAMFQAVKLWITDKYDWMIELITTSEVYVFIRDSSSSAYHAIKYFIQYSILEWVGRVVEIMKQYMTEEQRLIMDGVMGFLFRFRDNIWSFLPRLINHPLIQVIAEKATAVWIKAQWTLRYYELIPDGWLTVLRAYSKLNEAFTTTIEESSDRFDSLNYIYCAPELGQIEMDQYLPFAWSDLKTRPKLSDVKEIRALYDFWQSFQSTEEETLEENQAPPFMSWYYTLTKKLNYRTWLPPFSGQGLLAGRQHYVTFDGQVMEFAGTCSYLLSHDFTDSNFTIAVNYEGTQSTRSGRPVKRSLTVWMDGHEIEIHPNFQISVGKRKVQLPQSFGHTAILRDGNKILVRNGYGLLVTCYPVYDVCTFRVSGWYFGRMAGLLGTYNNEPYDDVVTPDGRVSRGLASVWGHSWTTDKPSQCRLSQNLALEPTKKDPYAETLCLTLFNDTFSNFRRCYRKVDPQPFLNMCLSDIQSRNATEDVCTSAAAYVYTCNSHDVSIRMPRNCVKCVLPNNHILHEGGNVTMNSSSKMADVVFVIEAKKCNREIVGAFKDLLTAIDGALHRASIQETRFAIVVFGGSGARDEPHIHTADSKIFSNQISALNASMSNFRVGRGTHDVFDALRFVAKLPFRPGASKSAVLISCSFGEVVEMRPDYPEVHRMLLEDGITVHLLLDREFNVKNPDLFYGIDGARAYTAKDGRSPVLKGDSDLRRQVAPPKDIYVPIALESNGTVFSSLRLYDQHRAAKSFVDVFGRRLAQSAEQRTCHTCDCLPDDDGVGRVYCQPCVFPRPAHVYFNSDDMFDANYTSIYQAYKNYKDPYDTDEKDHDETGSLPVPEVTSRPATPVQRERTGERKNTSKLTKKTRRKTSTGQ